MRAYSLKYSENAISFKYKKRKKVLCIYQRDIKIIQVKCKFDRRFTENTLQFFGDILYDIIKNKIEFMETACEMLIDQGIFDYKGSGDN